MGQDPLPLSRRTWSVLVASVLCPTAVVIRFGEHLLLGASSLLTLSKVWERQAKGARLKWAASWEGPCPSKALALGTFKEGGPP